MNADRKLSRKVRLFTAVWVIPVVAMGYIGWTNLLPLGSTATYVIDVGGDDLSGAARLTGPYEAVSNPMVANGTSFRQVENSPVDFELNTRRIRSAAQVQAYVTFKDSLREGERLVLGASTNDESGFYWKEIYVPFYAQLSGLTPVVEEGTTTVYATDGNDSTEYVSVAQFAGTPPIGSTIATNDPSLPVNQRFSSEEWGQMTAIDFPAEDWGETDVRQLSALPHLSRQAREEEGHLTVDIALRGGHTFWTYVNNGHLELQVTKQDLNWYQGPDELRVQVYSLEGALERDCTIPDDGNVGDNGPLGPLQSKLLSVDGLPPGAYRVEMQGWHDLFIRQIQVNQAKFVVDKRLFLAGSNAAYLGGGSGSEPVALYGYGAGEGELRFLTAHLTGLQQISIEGSHFATTVDVAKVLTWFETALNPGAYLLTVAEQDVDIRSSSYLSFTPDSFFVPRSSSNQSEDGTLVIDTALRGGHTFWTYVNNSHLELQVTKQDLNWYQGPDELRVQVYSLEGALEGNCTIPDDGNVGDSGPLGPLQSKSLSVDGLPPGAYRVEMQGWHDLLIRQTKVNQEKFVVEKRVFPVGVNSGYFDNRLTFDPVVLYGRSFGKSQVMVSTAHSNGLQPIAVERSNSRTEIDVNEVVTSYGARLEAGSYRIVVPNQDVDIRTNGYLSFTPDSWFLPKRCTVVGLKYDLSWVEENVDYAIINFRDYVPPAEDGGWMVAQTDWTRGDLHLDGERLTFRLGVLDADGSDVLETGIPLDSVTVGLDIAPLWQRI